MVRMLWSDAVVEFSCGEDGVVIFCGQMLW